MENYCSYLDTPSGTLKIITDRENVIEVGHVKKLGEASKGPKPKVHTNARNQLKEYFLGKRTEFDLPLYFEGTIFQKRVWNSLQKIPFGKTMTYGEVAKIIGNPKAFRAVGGACNKNKMLIIVPCHRVLGAGNKLVGFAAGVKCKEMLIGLEHQSDPR